MRLTFAAALLTSVSLCLAAPLAAQEGNSRPVAEPIVDIVPPAEDRAYPGTMTLAIDATDVGRAIFRAEQTIPVAPEQREAGRMTLLYPEWLPGNHAPRGEIEKLVGIEFSAGGKPLKWRRDNLDVYALHVDLPAGVETVTARFQFVSPTVRDQGRVVVTPKMMNLRWHNMALYPAGYYTRDIPVRATVTWPKGWQAATALRPVKTDGETVTYGTVDFDTLVDSPVFAGEHFKSWPLSDKVTLNVVADEARYLEASEEQIAHHRKLVAEAANVFGSQHYDHYDFLLALTEEMGGIGLEHHRSSENGVGTNYFTEWDAGPGPRDLLPHEMTHSWNGKYRRPAGIWTPDFRQDGRDDLLWVYEGQTQFWGVVLAARSGLYSKQQALDELAGIAAGLDLRKGRSWRPLADTTHDPIISARKPKAWPSWQRSEDYYNEGLMIWLEADQIIRRESGGGKSLQDFARGFFGGRDGDWGVITYEFDDVVAALNAVQPYDWDQFLRQRVFETSSETPKGGLTLGGYDLVYTDTPSDFVRYYQAEGKFTDLRYSLGLAIENDGELGEVIWDSPAFAAGLVKGETIVSVNGSDYSGDLLTDAVRGRQPLELLVKHGKRIREVRLSYKDGLRYPALRKRGEGETGLDRLLAPQTP